MQLINPAVQDMLSTLPAGERDELLALIGRAAPRVSRLTVPAPERARRVTAERPRQRHTHRCSRRPGPAAPQALAAQLVVVGLTGP